MAVIIGAAPFQATDALENKKLKFLGWRGPTHTVKTIKRLTL
jgi:inorganic pyrophosphatase